MPDSSQWKKWDLHIHTPDSFQNNFVFNDAAERTKFLGKIWDKYVHELEKVKDISVIGITDYFTIDGYKKILEYKNNGKLANFDLILPNVELRLDILSGKDNKRLNFHIIFSNEIDPNEIEDHFLHSLEFQTGKGESRRLTRRNIEEIGRNLKEENQSFQGNNFEVGCKNITVNLEQILDTLTKSKSKFYGKFLLVLSASEWDDIGWDGQGHIIKKHSLFRSHAVFSSNPKTIDFCLGRLHPSVEEFEKEFNQIKPCIHGSDSHSFDKLCKLDEDRFCWIKAIPTFDGLRQIIFEPEGRVKIQKDNPEVYKNIHSLNSLTFYDSSISDDISIEPQRIVFNKNFVAITGGKGSGKTAILDLIANCYVDRCRRVDDEKNEDKNSFVQRIQEDGNNLGVKLDFIDGTIQPFSKKLTDKEFIENSPITYLPQGKIEEISGNKSQLNEKIQEIIFNNEKVKEKNFKEKFTEIKENTVIISKNLFDLNVKIAKLENETTKEIFTKQNNETQIAAGKLADVKNQIQKIEANLEEGIQEKINSLKKEIKEIKLDLSNCLTITNEINLLNGGIQNFVVSSNKTIESINIKVQNLEIPFQIPEIDFEDQISALNNVRLTLESKREIFAHDLLKKETDLLELSGEEKTHTKLIKETELLEQDIKRFTEKFGELEKKKEEISKIEKERETHYEDLLNTFLEWKKYYDEVIQVFSGGKSDILGDINFKSNISFDYEKFSEIANDIINRKKISTEEIKTNSEKINDALSGYFSGHTSFETVSGAIKLFLFKQSAIKKNRSTKEFYDWLFGNYYTLDTDIDFKGTSIDKLSMGQKGSV
ncbi:MAG: AAA family ATPase [Methanoregula sp.]|nr:AAA family ATPase [Methanoregula sp.]